MKVRQEMVKERVDKKDVDIIYIKMCRMLTDILTKPMSGEKFYKFVRALLNHLVPLSEQQGCVEQNDIGRGSELTTSARHKTN
jgi:hypothetical protein